MIEDEWLRMKLQWGLSSMHLFADDSYRGFRCFVSRRDPKGIQTSVTEGLGNNWAEAIADCEENLRVGPIKANARITAAKAERASAPPGASEVSEAI